MGIYTECVAFTEAAIISINSRLKLSGSSWPLFPSMLDRREKATMANEAEPY